MKWLIVFDLDGVLAEGLDDMQAALRSAVQPEYRADAPDRLADAWGGRRSVFFFLDKPILCDDNPPRRRR